MLKVVVRVIGAALALALAAALVVIGTNAAVILSTRGDIVEPEQAAAYNADAIVVLGASVLPDGTPSGILQDRLDDAIALYFAGAAPKIIMSGDNGSASYNECWAMKRYAVERGVPSEDERSEVKKECDEYSRLAAKEPPPPPGERECLFPKDRLLRFQSEFH